MSQQDKDSEFEAYLQGKSSLSDSYAGLPQPRLPDHLDAAILAEAHRAVGARPGSRRWHSWMVPVSMAATLFVVVIIGAQLRYLLPSSEAPQAARSDSAASGKLAKEMPKTENLAAQDKVMAPAPAPEPARQQVAREPERRLMAAAPPPAQAVANKPMEAERAAPAAAAPAALAEKQEAMQREEAASASRAGVMAKKKALSESEVSDYAARPGAPAAAAAPPMSSVPEQAAKADAENLLPEEWLARIRQLKQQGKLDEAGKELAAFKKRYPAYTVPKDIELH